MLKNRSAFQEAETSLLRALDLRRRKQGADHPEVAVVLHELAALESTRGKPADAIRYFTGSIAIQERTAGRDDIGLTNSLDGLAQILAFDLKSEEAVPIMQRSLAIRLKVLGPDHPSSGLGHAILAGIYYGRDDWVDAVDHFIPAARILSRGSKASVKTAVRGTAATGRRRDVDRLSVVFKGLFNAADEVVKARPDLRREITAKMFIAAQWAAQPAAAVALAQMSTRQPAGSTRLADLVRERQDLHTEFEGVQGGLLQSAFAGTHTVYSQGNSIETSMTKLIRNRIAEIDGELKSSFPRYFGFINPEPVALAETQRVLAADEALVQFVATDVDIFAWVVTKTDAAWRRVELDARTLVEHVRALRCGLDSDQWIIPQPSPSDSADDRRRKDDQRNRAAWCQETLKATVRGLVVNGATQSIPPFDLARAHALYQALLQPFDQLIAGKSLLVVPTGPLTQLPLQVLISAKPPRGMATGAARDFAWLARQHAVTVLPSVTALVALRTQAGASRATRPFLGFGNPLLDGDPRNRSDVAAARQAREKQHCPQRLWPRPASVPAGTLPTGNLRSARRSIPPEVSAGVISVDAIRALAPLPETADELCDVAASLGATADDIRLGSRATESELNALDRSGRLREYRIVHFATHGALAGEVRKDSEPGLILTPPRSPLADDDGYLSASKIARLKFDADWAILSACNTAGGNAEGAEALSGLARAFFYAGVRALLVSHWAVSSESTVKLIRQAVASAKTGTMPLKSVALQRAMLELIDRGDEHESHPAFWAPFVVVGGGN